MNEAMKYKGCHTPETDNGIQITHGMHMCMLEHTHTCLSAQQSQSMGFVQEIWVDYI